MFLKLNFKKIGLSILLLTAIIIGVFLVTAHEMPKYKSFMVFFLFLILSDFYLWNYAKNIILKQIGIIKIFLWLGFWFTLFLSFVFFITSLIVDIKDWNTVFRTYITGGMLILYSPKIFAVFFLLLSDIFRLIRFVFTFLFRRNRFTQKFPNKRLKLLLIIGNAGALTIFTLLLWGMIFSEFDFKVRKISFHIKNLPTAFNGLKIVQISDLHLGSWYGKKPLIRAVEIINDLKPDLIFFTGDLVNYTTSETYNYKDVLGKLRATKGIYSILGNHDYGEYVKWDTETDKAKNMKDLIDFEHNIGWNLLMNSNARIQKDSSFIYIAGVENWGKNPRFPKKGNLNQALQGIDTNAFIILLSHDPSHWSEIVSKDYQYIALTLSGHTHGMQLGISTDDFEWSPAQYIYKNWAGLYKNEFSKKEQYHYVNRGLGVIGYPGRIGIKPEITLIELNK
jgi:hypothetical protein